MKTRIEVVSNYKDFAISVNEKSIYIVDQSNGISFKIKEWEEFSAEINAMIKKQQAAQKEVAYL